MTAINFSPLRPEHARIAMHLRKADLDEINSLNGLTPAVAVAFSIANSEKGAAVFIDGKLSAIFGISNRCIWLLATDDISRHPVAFYRLSRRIFHELRKGCPCLENWVDARNSLSLRWLHWLGFTIEPPQFIGGCSCHHVFWKEE